MSTPALPTPTPTPTITPSPHELDLFGIVWDRDTWSIAASVNVWVIGGIALLVITALLVRAYFGGFNLKNYELDQAEIGIGDSKISFRPNNTDKQVAYAIWVELSTRKIGLLIDLEHDLISEIYDSWYEFFSITRELIKDIPVTKVNRDSTQAIIKLSINVLNNGLRPHLTQWQARFRRWNDRELARVDSDADLGALDLQKTQERFPYYDELKTDLLTVNASLIKYRKKMHELVLRD